MLTDWIFGAIVVAYLLFLAAVVARMGQNRRMQRLLRWPISTTQRQMERWGARYLAGMGWSLSLASSHATISMYVCMKEGEHIHVVFLRGNSAFARLMATLRSQGSGVLNRLMIVLYEPPTERMLAEAAENSALLMHFNDLPEIEDRLGAILPHVMAARDVIRPHRRWLASLMQRGNPHRA